MPTSFTSFNDGDIIQDEHIEQYAAPVNNIELGIAHYCEGNSGTDDYTATITPAPPTLNSGAKGYWFHFKPDVNSGGASTIALNGGGAKSIKLRDGNDLGVDSFRSTGIYKLVFDGTNFVAY